MLLIKLLLALAVAGLMPAVKNKSSQTLSLQTTVSAQEFYKYLRCHRQAKNIVINWGVASTAGVLRFVVYHSEDGEFFDPIAQVDPDGTLKYTFKQEAVFAGYHHYYIAAVMNAGPPVNSPVDIVRIVGH